jgi:aspartyl-tRNA(Asn)/glutamyl-tRNA(Gln) amidotransferase subunit B
LHGTEFEVERQTRILNEGGKVVSETRGWREETGETVSQRSKEEAHDYRYFPEPDLPPLAVSREMVEELRRSLPELPDARRARFVAAYGLSEYEANLLTESRARADFYEETLGGVAGSDTAAKAKTVANWVLGDLSRLLNDSGMELDDPEIKITASSLAKLLNLLQSGTIVPAAAKEVLRYAFETGDEPEKIVAEKELGAIQDDDVIASAVKKAIADNAKAVVDYRAGKEAALKALVGPVMRETKGRANPQEVLRLIQAELDRTS